MNNNLIILTKEEIGDAIVNYIGTFKKGMSFFPFRISNTDISLHLPDEILFTLEYIPMGTKSITHSL